MLPQSASPQKSPAEIDLSTGEEHFAPLMKICQSAEERWAGKANANTFGGL
jgi:hypothetical protein